MRVQHYAHTAVQENNFDLRLFAWQYFLPFYFALDKTNYARYGSFYVETTRQIEQKHPGLKHLLEEKGISVLAQENHNIRTAIDQRGEQTIIVKQRPLVESTRLLATKVPFSNGV